MTERTHASAEPRARRLPPALVFDLPVLAFLLVCWLTVAVALAHLLTGLALVGLIAAHLLTRRARVGRLFRRPRAPGVDPGARHRLAWRPGYLLFLLLAAGMAVTGLLRWAGVPREHAWHATTSYALLGLTAIHLWAIRRPLRARLRRPRRWSAPDARADRAQRQRQPHLLDFTDGEVSSMRWRSLHRG
jgi:hypothetical protein